MIKIFFYLFIGQHYHHHRRMFPPIRVTFSFNDQQNAILLPNQHNNNNNHFSNATNQPRTPSQLNNININNNNVNITNNNNNNISCNSNEKFHVLMDILPYDKKRYRYAYHKSSWQQAGKADPPSPTKLFLHPDGPFTLDQLRRQVISFEKIKLTNNDANKHGYVSNQPTK